MNVANLQLAACRGFAATRLLCICRLKAKGEIGEGDGEGEGKGEREGHDDRDGMDHGRASVGKFVCIRGSRRKTVSASPFQPNRWSEGCRKRLKHTLKQGALQIS